ncbi:glycoside hydrolase superfamily [Mycena sp. CBHHK59/15]|nr:glycoside hydrolase superfamily [Mycena sp. CBHHK59/15]
MIVNISPQWAAAYVKATASVQKMSLQDKVNLATGHCVGNTPEISSISFPGLCLEDSPVGVRDSDLVSVFPAFNRTLMNQRAIALGQEFKGKGVHVALGPMMNLMRSPAAGRNWEGFGGDPYLSGEGAYETIIGIQSAGVQATAKHYINNEQEHFRDASSSNQHELYALPFLRSVQANVASVIQTVVNSSFACENDKTLNGILKSEYGFQGCSVPAFYAVADWWATHSTLSINSGLDVRDITLGSGTTYFGSTLVNAVNSGSVSQARINDMATRILAVNFDAWNNNAAFNKHVNVQSDHKALIRQIDAASTVLLKNTNGTLPLKAPKTIAIVGNGAANSSAGPNGTANFPYLIAPLDAIKVRASADGTTVSSSTSDTDLSSAKNAATGKAIAFVFITGNAGDRNSLSAWHSGDALIAAVASVNKNTVVVVNAVGPINMEAWITNPNIVWSGIPGQEAGNGLVDVLYGAYNPSGRLPYTIGKSITDYSAQVTMTQTGTITPITYSEGSLSTIGTLTRCAGITPRFEFGFGLSYTTFVYSGLTISGSTSGGTRQTGPGSALDPWLHDAVVTVTFTVQNSGTVSGNEVPQLYLTFPASANSAPKNLKGFDSVFVGAGQSVAVSMTLSRFDFSTWNLVTQRWEIATGTTTISIGASSRDIRLTGTIVN